MTTVLRTHPKVAIRFLEQSYTYEQLLACVHQYTNLMTVAASERIVIFSENRPEWIIALYAIWHKQCIVVPVDNLLTEKDVAYIIDDCKPTLCFTSTERLGVLTQALTYTHHKPTILVFEQIQLDANTSNASPVEIHNPKNDVAILYTSGTTGNPKGVVLSFENIYLNIHAVTQKVTFIQPQDALICLLPFHHILPLVGNIIIPMYIGCSIAISPSLQGNDIIDTLQKNNISIIIGVPQLFEALRNSILLKIEQSKIASLLFSISKKAKFHHLSKKIFKAVHTKFGGQIKYFISGGAALDKEVALDLYTLGFDIIEGYGMTETAPLIAFTYPNKWKVGSVGFLMPDTEIKFVSNEICIKGKQIMRGYYNQPQATSETIINGWLHTGDLGLMDKDGYLFITGRKKELIILSNGKNITPIEIEDAIKHLNNLIIECACFAMNDQLQILLITKELLSEDAMQNCIRTYNQTVPSYKQIRKYYNSTEALPKTRLGKIQRFLLPDLVSNFAKQKTSTSEPLEESYVILKKYLQKLLKQKNISPDDTFEFDLGIDSLNKIALTFFIQNTFGVSINEQTFKENTSVLQLFQYIEQHKNKIALQDINWTNIIHASEATKLHSTWKTIGLLKLIATGMVKATCKIKVYGKDNIPNSSFILVANHESYIDGILMVHALPYSTYKNTYFYAKIKSFKNIIKYTLAIHNNIVLVDLEGDMEHSIQQLTTVLKQGKNIVIFPEGTRTRDGELNEFKPMYAILSKEINIPILPVAINGSYEAMPPGQFLPKMGSNIDITFLPPVYPHEYDYEKLNHQVKETILQQIK